MNTIFSPFRTILFFLAVASTAWLILPQLKVDLLPAEKSSTLTISYSQPNVSPDIIEQQATAIIEGACSQLSQLKKIYSVSKYNSGYVQLEFDKSADIQMKQFEVAAIIRRIYPQLPSSVSYPVIEGGNNSGNEQDPLLIYSVNAPIQPYYIKQQAEEIFQKVLAGVSGIKEVKISGTENQQITIRFNKDKCNAWRVQPAYFIDKLQNYFTRTYPGNINNASGEVYFIEIKAPKASIQAIQNILLPVKGNNNLLLKDIAEVYIEEQEPQSYFRINGKNSVSLNVYVRSGENKIVIGKSVKQLIQKAANQLPAGYEVRLDYDDTEFLEKEIAKNYQRSILSVSILLLFILIAYRNWRYLFNLFAGLLITLCLTLIWAWFFNTGIHLYTIAGLAISFGIMIDNAIVMLDYYHKYRSRKMFTALLAATLTTIAALLLIFFLPEEERNNLIDFAVIIILALISSLITALWFTPGLYRLTMYGSFNATKKTFVSNKNAIKRKIKIVRAYYSTIQFLGRYRKTFICLVILGFGLPVFMLPAKWEGSQWYHGWYNNSIGNEYYQESIRPYIDKWLGGALRLFVNNVYEKSGYRSPEKTKLYVNAELPYGNTPEQMNDILTDFEGYLSGIEGIDKYITNIYSGQGGSIEIYFKEGFDNSSLPYQLKSKLIARSLDWGGVAWNVYGVGQGFSNAGNEDIPSFRVTMKGYNYDELEKQANILKEKLLKHKRIQKVNTNERIEFYERQSSEYVLNLDKEKMALHNTNQFEILNAIKNLSKPTGTMAQVTIDDKYYPVIAKDKDADAYSNFDLLHYTVQLDSGKAIALNEIGKIELNTISNSIHKEDRQYIRIVSFEYMGSGQFGSKYLESVLQEMKQQMPVGYTAEQKSWYWDWNKRSRNYMLIAALLLTIFFIGSVLLENLKEPFFIISMIPISFIGLFLIFSIGDFYFDQGGYAAFIMLGGLVANAAIFIVNDYNNLKRTRNTTLPNKLLVKAVSYRARTILLTTISTCCGLVPFLIEGQNEVFWFSLATGTIGGVAFSLFAVFIVLPVLLWKKQKLSAQF